MLSCPLRHLFFALHSCRGRATSKDMSLLSANTALLNKEKSYFKTELKEIKSIRFWLTVQLDILIWEVYVSTSCTNIIEFQLHALFKNSNGIKELDLSDQLLLHL